MQKINVAHTIFSGQVFLWQKQGKTWYGVNGNDILAVSEDSPEQVRSHLGAKYDLFRQGDDFEKIVKTISKDKVIAKATKDFPGLRLMRQDPFQCYISFIVSANSSIQNIKGSLHKISRKFGKKIKFDKMDFSLFPEPQKIAAASESELLSCGLGYRAKFVKGAALAVREKQIDFDFLKKASYDVAKESLLQIDGIGNKVADCVMLFSLEKLEAFPLDRWIIRSLQEYYPEKFSFGGKTLTDKKYQTLHGELVDYFGLYAGYCQQFLFKMIRDSNQKKWL
ncbi:MAG: DNA-3-methyladenine glycosylase family protein [Nitrososphaerota archaeon]